MSIRDDMRIHKFHNVLAMLAFLLIITGAATAQNPGDRLLTTVSLFRGSTPLGSYSSWFPIGSFSLPQATLVQGSATPIEQKWRLKISYHVENAGSRFALQARVDLNQNQSPIFSVAWDDGRVGRRQAYTNWLQPELLGFNSQAMFPVSLNLIPSGDGQAPADVYVDSVELEIWEIAQAGARTGTQIASVASPTERMSGAPRTSAQNKKSSVALALETSVNFLRAASTGGLGSAKRYLSNDVVSLSSLEPLSPSSVPLLKLPMGMSFDDYLANYEPQIFSYSQFAGLFDDLESHQVNGWQLSSKSYLFIGNNTKSWGKDVLPGQPLVFVLEEENGTMKVKAFP